MSLIQPGAMPPFIVPYCGLCGQPAERGAIVGGRALHDKLVLSAPQSAYYIELEAQCCGKTQGRRVSIDEIMRLKRTNEKLFLVVSSRRFQGIGALRRVSV